jgi:hypothetical protein
MGCLGSFLGCLVLLYKLFRLALRVPKLFPRLLRLFLVYMCFFLGTIGLPRLYPRLLKFFHNLHSFFGTLVDHALS